ncbi:uncharacterized protein LOC122322371 [Drosophila grimshawi]|uniref:uncharacterized protein LOC122322371 n=1 Tax=Drosophila grimshawi TaxID=7222 RepID=UPI001C931A48|nr:uncharacterized protein LOC122322371 [Drosophila grimshawi]
MKNWLKIYLMWVDLSQITDRFSLTVNDRVILDSTFEMIKELIYKEETTILICSLALHNPPNTPRCTNCIYCKGVQKCLSMNNISSKRVEKNLTCQSRDHIENIIINDLYNEDALWQNVHCQEGEVLKLLIEELVIHATSQENFLV